jgi:hypothetical protein
LSSSRLSARERAGVGAHGRAYLIRSRLARRGESLAVKGRCCGPPCGKVALGSDQIREAIRGRPCLLVLGAGSGPRADPIARARLGRCGLRRQLIMPCAVAMPGPRAAASAAAFVPPCRSSSSNVA